jgi:hypothetical protein
MAKRGEKYGAIAQILNVGGHPPLSGESSVRRAINTHTEDHNLPPFRRNRKAPKAH